MSYITGMINKKTSALSVVCRGFYGARGENRTLDARFRKPTLYPLSYTSMTGEMSPEIILTHFF